MTLSETSSDDFAFRIAVTHSSRSSSLTANASLVSAAHGSSMTSPTDARTRIDRERLLRAEQLKAVLARVAAGGRTHDDF